MTSLQVTERDVFQGELVEVMELLSARPLFYCSFWNVPGLRLLIYYYVNSSCWNPVFYPWSGKTATLWDWEGVDFGLDGAGAFTQAGGVGQGGLRTMPRARGRRFGIWQSTGLDLHSWGELKSRWKGLWIEQTSSEAGQGLCWGRGVQRPGHMFGASHYKLPPVLPRCPRRGERVLLGAEINPCTQLRGMAWLVTSPQHLPQVNPILPPSSSTLIWHFARRPGWFSLSTADSRCLNQLHRRLSLFHMPAHGPCKPSGLGASRGVLAFASSVYINSNLKSCSKSLNAWIKSVVVVLVNWDHIGDYNNLIMDSAGIDHTVMYIVGNMVIVWNGNSPK